MESSFHAKLSHIQCQPNSAPPDLKITTGNSIFKECVIFVSNRLIHTPEICEDKPENNFHHYFKTRPCNLHEAGEAFRVIKMLLPGTSSQIKAH